MLFLVFCVFLSSILTIIRVTGQKVFRFFKIKKMFREFTFYLIKGEKYLQHFLH